MSGKDQTGPPDPITPTDEGCVALHELYLGLRRAGFTMIEATSYLAALSVHQRNAEQGGDS